MRRDTLEELYRAHYRPALLYTLSLCGDPAQAEDIVSAAFETALLTLEEGSQVKVTEETLAQAVQAVRDAQTPSGAAGGPAADRSGRCAGGNFAGGAVRRPLPGSGQAAGAPPGAADSPLFRGTAPGPGRGAGRPESRGGQDRPVPGPAAAETDHGGGWL